MSKEPENPTERDGEVSRREFLGTAGAALVVTTATPGVAGAQERRDAGAPVRPRTAIRLTVNGASRRIEVDDHWTLAELLRDHLRLTGTKLGCERGECGACTVLVDDKPVYSCSYLAVWADGKTVMTVEGLSRDGKLRSAAGSVHRARCAAVRLLHLGPVDVGHGAAQGEPDADGRGRARRHSPATLPLFELQPDRRSGGGHRRVRCCAVARQEVPSEHSSPTQAPQRRQADESHRPADAAQSTQPSA